MVKTYGLTHISLAVADPERSLEFYRQVFGVEEYFRNDTSIQVLGPGPHDVIAFQKSDADADAGAPGGIAHFGFRLTDPADIDQAVREVEAAGGKLRSRGEFGPGLPYAFIEDPDGYEVEIWFE